jgi:hypothetical protein
MKKENRKKTQDWYLPRLLKELQTTTGLVFKAVCSGGAALIHPGDGGAFFGELLEHVPGGLSVIVAIVSGNDLLVNWKVPDLDSSVLRAAERLCVDMKAKSLLQYAVVGMSSSTWSYDRWMDAGARARYDRNAVELSSCFEAAGVRSTTGVAELRGVVAADCVGHVSVASERVVFAAYRAWLRACLEQPEGLDAPPAAPADTKTAAPVPAAAAEPPVGQGAAEAWSVALLKTEPIESRPLWIWLQVVGLSG